MKYSNKKGQEEIVGFVAIVLLVTIVGLVFLGISISKDTGSVKKSNDIARFLDSAMSYTSECAIGYEPNYASVKDLLGRCYSDSESICTSGKKTCETLNDTLKGILDNSWKVGSESKNKGYDFKADFSLNASSKENGTKIIAMASGNCSSASYVEGDNFFSFRSGSITSQLRICY